MKKKPVLKPKRKMPTAMEVSIEPWETRQIRNEMVEIANVSKQLADAMTEFATRQWIRERMIWDRLAQLGGFDDAADAHLNNWRMTIDYLANTVRFNNREPKESPE